MDEEVGFFCKDSHSNILDAHGIVYKCHCLKSGQLKALKRIILEHSDRGIPSTALRESAKRT